jgi:hypothetical protein
MASLSYLLKFLSVVAFLYAAWNDDTGMLFIAYVLASAAWYVLEHVYRSNS